MKNLANGSLKIIDTEVHDNSNADDNGVYDVSGVSVVVEIKYNNTGFYIDYQTSSTHDHGAISSNLKAYNEGLDNLESLFTDNDRYIEFLKKVWVRAGVQEKWNEYIDGKYTRNDDLCVGMDANSESNEMIKK